MSTEQSLLTDQTLIDYLRICTFDPIQFYNLTAEIERDNRGWRPKRWMQYKGRQSDNGIFHGIGDQAGRAHFIIQVSGLEAARFYNWLNRYDPAQYSTFYCTRIDIQRTQTNLTREYRRTAYKRLKGAKSIIESDTGITLYIGSRTSDTFWRLYDKTDSLLRVEVEIKAKMAKRVWVALGRSESLGSVWNTFLKRSRVPAIYADQWRDGDGLVDMPIPEQTEDRLPKLQYLITLDAMVYKLLNDHDTRERATSLVNRWSQYAADLDTGDNSTVQSDK